MSTPRSHDSPERIALRRRAAEAEQHGEHDTPTPHPLVALGGQVGNAAVARMLAQREGEEEEVAAKHDLAQREGEEEEEVAAKHDLAQAQPEVGLEGGPLSGELSGRINSQRGGGASLDDGTRTTMERSFGTSFEGVRVHTDGESDALNHSISAKAFTTGNDIFFRKDTSPGDHGLLAHELTHVVQQRSSSGSSGGMSVGPAGDSHEQQADAVSTAVTSGTASTAAAQREADEARVARSIAQREGAEEEEAT